MARRGRIEKVVEPVDVEVRPVRSRRYVYFVLIVCEDKNTEPKYFKQFEDLFENLLPEDTVFVKRVGTGRNSLGAGLMKLERVESFMKLVEMGEKYRRVNQYK